MIDHRSKSLARRRLRPSQPKVRSITQRVGFALGQQGRFQEAMDAADRGLTFAKEVDHLPTLAAAFHFRGVVHGWYGDLPTSVANFDQAIHLSEKSGDLFRQYLAHGWRGEAYLIADELQSAEDDIVKCLALGDKIGTSFHRAAFEAFLAQIRLLLGDVPSACQLSADAIFRGL